MGRDSAAVDRSDDGDGRIRRRTLLRSAGASLIAAGIAGCNTTQQQRYEADPVALAPGAAELGFRSDQNQWVENARSVEVEGNSLEVTLASYAATYRGDPIGIATAATPTAEEVGQSLNPLVHASFEDLLTGVIGAPLREQIDLGIETEVEWRRDPRAVETTAGELLGGDVEIETFVGVTDRSEAVVIHLTRTIDDGDAVFVGSGRSRPIDPGSERPLVEEEGVFPPGEIDDGREVFRAALEHVNREEATELGAIPGFEMESVPVVDWPVEDLGGDRRRYWAAFEDGSRVPLEDPVRYRQVTDRAPDPGASVQNDRAGGVASIRDADQASSALGSVLDAFGDQQNPNKVSLRSDQTSLKQQGRRRTCVVHCIAGAIEAEFNRQGETLDLDEQYGQHINKMTYLHGNPDGGITRSNLRQDNSMSVSQAALDGFENFLSMGGGGSLKKQLAMYSRYGLTDGRVPYQGRWNGNYENTNQSGDDPRHQWNDPTSATQRAVNDYNTADDPTTIQVPGSMSYTPFPQEALENARYRIDDYGYRDSAPSNTNWASFIESKLANERTEVLVSVRVSGCVNTSGGVWTVPNNPSNCAAHCLSIVGYDKTGNQNVFLAKNSWNTYNTLSYNYVNQMVIDAGWLKGVEKRPADGFYPELFMGRWTLNYDGLIGTLDVRRLGDFFDASDLGGEQDMRLGDFFDFNDQLHRVNGETRTTGHGGEIEFYIDESNPYCAYDHTGGKQFTGRLAREEPRLMAGTFTRPNGETAPFYASKDGTIGSTADSNWVSPGSMVGNWSVHSPVLGGQVELTSSAANGSVSGRYYYRGSNFVANSGTLDAATNALQLELPTGSDRWEFDGYVHENDRGTASGFVSTRNGNERYPIVLAREGPANADIRITAPNDGASLQSGGVGLSATVDVDGQSVSNPGVVWTLDGPYDPSGNGGSIIGRGANASAKLPAGSHRIYATYTGDPSAVDTITVSVNSQRAPSVTIASPSDGQSWSIGDHDGVSGNPYTDVSAQGSATAGDGTSLTGSDLEWSVREDGDTSWRNVGTGTSTTIRLYDYHCSGTGYDVRLEATDANGTIGTEVVSAWVNLFGC